jgi:hypothetical protein
LSNQAVAKALLVVRQASLEPFDFAQESLEEGLSTNGKKVDELRWIPLALSSSKGVLGVL